MDRQLVPGEVVGMTPSPCREVIQRSPREAWGAHGRGRSTLGNGTQHGVVGLDRRCAAARVLVQSVDDRTHAASCRRWSQNSGPLTRAEVTSRSGRLIDHPTSQARSKVGKGMASTPPPSPGKADRRRPGA